MKGGTLIRSLALILLALALLVQGRAQVNVPNVGARVIDRSVFGLGLSAGLASGFGLSFRHHLPGPVSYQVVGGIIKLDRRLHYDIGAELQADLVRNDAIRFFAGGAGGYFFSGEVGHNDLSAPGRIGLGVGGEWNNIPPFCLTGELLFTYFTDGIILPLPQVSAHYYFF